MKRQALGPAVVGAPLAEGTILQGTYRIVRPLAEGGCGEVYLATHVRLPCQVAIKTLHRSLAGDAQALARFRQEAEITSALRHPHIVQMFDFNVTEQGVAYLVMELLQGRPLASDLAPGKPIEPRAAVHIVEQIAQALQVAHAHGIVHRDLKPDNVMLLSVDGRDDFVKVVDFGISQASWRRRLTEEQLVAGTPQYMAPEQASARRDEIDHRADQFSLAAIAYTMLAGREAFCGDDPVALLYQVVHEQPAAPSESAPWLGAGVDAVIARGMSKRPADRYPSITAFAAALRDAIEEADAPRRRDAPPLRPREAPPLPVLRPGPTVDEAEPSVAPAGRETLRLIRKTRRRIRGHRSGAIVLALAAASAFAWFSPATRGGTRAAWHRASAEAHRVRAEAHRVIAGATTRNGQASSGPDGVSMP